MSTFIRVGNLAALVLGVTLLAPSFTQATEFELSVTIAPPGLPVYEQPPIPGPGFIWVPGYWAYGSGGYFWVPGTWFEPPEVGLLWTPGYWAWSNGMYVWTAGYWGPVVGFYGGINYGFGYSGQGYEGGYWQGDQLYYNRSVNNVSNTQLTNVYNKTVVNNVTVNNVSYNGGSSGVDAQPTAREQEAARQRHVAPTAAQAEQRTTAASHRELLASINHGKPEIAATAEPNAFSGRGVTHATAAGSSKVATIREARAQTSDENAGRAPPKSSADANPGDAASEQEHHVRQADPERQGSQDVRASQRPQDQRRMGDHAGGTAEPQGQSQTQQPERGDAAPQSRQQARLREAQPQSQRDNSQHAAQPREAQPRAGPTPKHEERKEEKPKENAKDKRAPEQDSHGG